MIERRGAGADTMPRMRHAVGLAQIATRPGRITDNLETHRRILDRAGEEGLDAVVFPELSVSGYTLAHAVDALALSEDDDRLRPILDASREMTVVVGLPLRERTGGVSNAALVCEGGEVVAIHRKLYLPTYGMFDEGRFFVPGDSLTTVETRCGRWGILICEDAWHPSTAVMLARRGVDAIVVASGGPAILGPGPTPASGTKWEWIVGATAVTTVTPVLFANRWGWEEGVLFSGGSHAVDGAGRRLCEPVYLEERLAVAELDLAQVCHTRTLVPLVANEREELWRRELEAGRDR